MKVIRAASQITQAFKNVGRLTEILRVFALHGFADVIHRLKLNRFLTKKLNASPKFQHLPPEVRLRMCFEQLGPAFVKLGQLFASRPDLIPLNFVEEFQKLQDQVPPTPWNEIKIFMEAEFKAPLTTVFAEVSETPLAAASIGQVYAAKLKTGEDVVIKVQRPHIDKIIHNDISILRAIAALSEKYIPESKIFNPVGVVEEFFKTMLFELDFMVEANNIRRIRKNMEPLKKIAVPEVYSQFCTPHILVLERFNGVRFSDREAILQKGISPSEIVQAGCEAFFKMVMEDGVFHGDLHAGNLFILDDGRIGIVDFGIVGRLPMRVRDGIIAIFVALVEEDFDTLTTEYLNLCQTTQEPNIGQLQKDLMDVISPYIGMSLGEVNVGTVLLRSTSVATKHHLQVPRELMLLFKAIFTIEGLGKRLDPHFDILQLGTELAKQTLKSRYSGERILRDLLVVGRDVQYLLETTPRMLRRFFRRWSDNHFAFEIKSPSHDRIAEQIKSTSHDLLLACFALICTGMSITLIVLDRAPHVLGYSLYGVALFLLAAIVIGKKLWWKF